MPEVLRFDDPRVVDDPRALLGGEVADEEQLRGGIAPLATWVALRPFGDVLPAVWVAAGEDVAVLRTELPLLRLIALDFPKAADGRAYSSAALLRRWGYRGELRAIGDVAIDQLFLMKRVGFDSAALRPEQRGADLLPTVRTVLATFSDAYQAAADEPLPLFRRRSAAGRP